MHKTQVFLVQQMALDLKIPQRCHLSRLVKAPVSYGHISEIGLGSIICHWGLTWLHLDLRPPGGPARGKSGWMVTGHVLEYWETWWDHICGHLV